MGNQMMVVAYSIYLAVSIGLTIWVARTLHKNGAVFLIDTFLGKEKLAESVNHLLVVGFYLVNIGFVTMALKSNSEVADWTTLMEVTSSKIGVAMLVLGGMHLFNVYVFNRIRRNAELRSAPPPVRPQGFIPPAKAIPLMQQG